MLQSFLIGIVAGIVLLVFGHPFHAVGFGLGIWMTGYLMMAASGWLTAILRGEEAYWGSQHEERGVDGVLSSAPR